MSTKAFESADAVEVARALREYLPGARWFPASGAEPDQVTFASKRHLRCGDQMVYECIINAELPGRTITCFVPFTITEQPRTDARVIAALPGGQRIIDAFTLAEYRHYLVRSLHGDGVITRDGFDHVELFKGQQSNTSLIVDGKAMVKVYRVLHLGDHPETLAARQLTAEQCSVVPSFLGSRSVDWAVGDDQVTGTLATAFEFIGDAEDAWDVACDAARAGRDFVDEAFALGRATRDIHAAFAAKPAPFDVTQQATRLRRRCQQIAAQTAELAPFAGRLATYEATVEAALTQASTRFTAHRIHGDYHLGQVLFSASRGVVVLDFEGEPLRPLAERTEPDSPWRDVAGMLRSFDYAAHTGIHDPAAASAWHRKATEAFLAGYGHRTPDPILWLYLVDKALYEVSYESHHRPDWLHLPLAGLTSALDMNEVNTVSNQAVPNQALPNQDGSTKDVESRDMNTAGASAADSQPTDNDTASSSTGLSKDDLTMLGDGAHWSPHSILGIHPVQDGFAIRTLRPTAGKVDVLLANEELPMRRLSCDVWEAFVEGDDVPDYRIRAHYSNGTDFTSDDPYRYLPTIGELDVHLFMEGRHERLWDVMGAHPHTTSDSLGTTSGVRFAVWAPNAQAVRVIGDFNAWNGTGAMLRSLGESGVWELFLPDAAVGQAYKYQILTKGGQWLEKADPMAQYAEIPPATASRITESRFEWTDTNWMSDRQAKQDVHSPMSIYEVHLGSWRIGLSYKELAKQLVDYVEHHGFTHVELMPVAEHPFGGSWGYQVSSYYAPTSRFGSPDEFRYLVNALHERGIGVIMDWVPAHFPKDEWSLGRFDGEPVYEHPDPRRGEHPDWGTYIFDFGRPQVRNFLVANAVYWCTEFHIDGLRVDAVASMLYLDYSREDGQWEPNQFGGRENLEAVQLLQEANAVAYREAPGITMIAEESTAYPGVTKPTDWDGLGFGFKWNMGWMHDTLTYLEKEPIHRKYHHGDMTFAMVYAYSENYILPISHDEVVHGKGTLSSRVKGDHWQQMASVRAYLSFMWSFPGKQLIFMGQEFAQKTEWSEGTGLDWAALDDELHRGVSETVVALNRLYKNTPAMYALDTDPLGFQWIRGDDADRNVFSYIRRDADGHELVAVINFAAVPYEGYEIGLPKSGVWHEVFNSDAEMFGGSGVGNAGQIWAEGDDAPDEDPTALTAKAWIKVPPLGAVFFVKG